MGVLTKLAELLRTSTTWIPSNQLSGFRGFLNLDGSFDHLASRDVAYHRDFAEHRFLDDKGFWEWFKRNPLPLSTNPGSGMTFHQIMTKIEKMAENYKWEPEPDPSTKDQYEWIEKLLRETPITIDFLLTEVFGQEPDMAYCTEYNAIRVWGDPGGELLLETPILTQKHLDAIWDFVTSNIINMRWKGYVIDWPGGSARGKIDDLPEKVKDLVSENRWQRVAIFEAMLPRRKVGELAKVSSRANAGYLFPNGSYVTLEDMGVSTHNQFAIKTFLQEAGAWDWIQANPPVEPKLMANVLGSFGISSLPDLIAEADPEWREQLEKNTNFTDETMADIRSGIRAFVRRKDAIRIWPEGRTLNLESWKWTQHLLDLAINWILDYVEEEKFERYVLDEDSTMNFSQGSIWDLPNKIDNLFERRRRVAAFEELKKAAAFRGGAGYLFSNGNYVTLDDFDVGTHESFAAKAFLMDADAWDWIQNNLPEGFPSIPGKEVSPWDVVDLIISSARNPVPTPDAKYPGWFNKLKENTNFTDETFKKVIDATRNFCREKNAIRVWPQGSVVFAETWKWTQPLLNVFTDWMFDHNFSNYAIDESSTVNNTEGKIEDIPNNVEDLFGRAWPRVAAFEAMLKVGTRAAAGYLFPDGSFETLREKGVHTHNQFAVKYYLEKVGAWDWIIHNPPLGYDLPQVSPWHVLEVIQATETYPMLIDDLKKYTGFTDETFAKINEATANFCKETGAIRIWPEGWTLYAETWKWTQALLDILTDWILDNIEEQRFKEYVIDEISTYDAARGGIWDLPSKVKDLFEKAPRRVAAAFRVAAFEAMLHKHAEFTGMRGFLYPDGGWVSLSQREVDSHAEFVQDLVLEDTGAYEWIQNHPIPGAKFTGPSGISWEIGKLRGRPGGMEYLQQLVAETGMTWQMLSAITESTPYDWYMEKTKAIRIWGEGDTLIAENPHWTQARLDLLWRFLIDNIEREGWSQAIVGSKSGTWEGPIWDLPSKIDELLGQRVGDYLRQVRKYRVAEFEKILQKHAVVLPGTRGFIDNNTGEFISLDSRGMGLHDDFAVDAEIEQSGAKEWVLNNPPPDRQPDPEPRWIFAPPPALDEIINARHDAAAGSVEAQQWLNDLFSSTQLEPETLTDIEYDVFLPKWLLKNNMTRVWISRGQLVGQNPKWTQQALDYFWEWGRPFIESRQVDKYIIADWDGKESRGEIWDMPERVEKLFRKERWRAASVRIEHKRLIAEADNWNQDKLNYLWKFATANIGDIKTFSVLDSAGRVCKGDIWDLPKRVKNLFN